MKLVIDINEQYKDFILNLLSNLQTDIIKKIEIEDNLEKFRKLRQNSNNKKILTMDSAINTNEMLNNDFF